MMPQKKINQRLKTLCKKIEKVSNTETKIVIAAHEKELERLVEVEVKKSKVCYTINPSVVTVITNNGHFSYIERRIEQIDDFDINDFIKHTFYFNDLKEDLNIKGCFKIRKIFIDDKAGGGFTCVVDYLTDKSVEEKPDLDFLTKNEHWITDSLPTFIDLEIISVYYLSDHYHPNHRDFYTTERVKPYSLTF